MTSLDLAAVLAGLLTVGGVALGLIGVIGTTKPPSDIPASALIFILLVLMGVHHAAVHLATRRKDPDVLLKAYAAVAARWHEVTNPDTADRGDSPVSTAVIVALLATPIRRRR